MVMVMAGDDFLGQSVLIGEYVRLEPLTPVQEVTQDGPAVRGRR